MALWSFFCILGGNPLSQSLAMLALVVWDYDEAIDYFTRCLRFTLLEDTDRGNGKRWVVVAPTGSSGANLLLAQGVNPEQESRIGNQTGGRVFLFLHTDDFWGDYEYLKAQGVHFIEQPRHEDFGTVVIFQDLYGNKWDLIEPINPNPR
jgi:catechol 2,3-dioxygenase-like lactoylglutathione lyase family enzyme